MCVTCACLPALGFHVHVDFSVRARGSVLAVTLRLSVKAHAAHPMPSGGLLPCGLRRTEGPQQSNRTYSQGLHSSEGHGLRVPSITNTSTFLSLWFPPTPGKRKTVLNPHPCGWQGTGKVCSYSSLLAQASQNKASRAPWAVP